MGAASLVFAGVGITMNVLARSEFDSLAHRCEPNCTANDLGRLHAEETSGIVFYTAAAATAATAVILLIVDRVRR
jgi:hypothetical protein